MNQMLNLRSWLALIFSMLVLHACATTASLTASDQARLERLLALIVERLELAPDVARSKWNSHAPVEDLVRERQIVASIGASAADYHVPREPAEAFFRAQIEASKVVQRAMLAQYEAARQPRFDTVLDLERDIRPHLDRLTPALLQAFADARPVLARTQGQAVLAARRRRLTIHAAGAEAAIAEALAPLVAKPGAP